MAWDQAALDAIDKSLKSGVLRVQFADRSITYRSVDELLRVRNLAASELAASGGTVIRRQLRVYTTKGNGC